MVIRTRDEAADIGRVLDGVLAQEEPADVVVIDSGSTDETIDVVRARSAVRLHQIEPAEFTFGGTCNLGMGLSTSEFVVFLSGHSWPVDRQWLTRLLEPFTDATVAGTYGSQRPRPGQDPVRAHGQVQGFAVDPKTGASLATFSNANSAVRRSAWETVAFDERLGGAEDNVWARRQVDLGRQVVYVYDAAVYHSHMESLQDVYRRHRREAEGLEVGPGEDNLHSYLHTWAYCTGRDVARLVRAGDLRWAAWAPAYYAARLLGEYSGRRPMRLWRAGRTYEENYWHYWFRTRGERWPEDYTTRLDPDSQLQEHLRELLDIPRGGTARILDVGAGPLTFVNKSWTGRTVEIAAVDALADSYDAILEEFEVEPLVRTEPCETERLLERFGTDQFDLAYARNSIDRCYDPLLAIRQMLAVTRPDGHVVLDHRHNAGVVERYAGFQQWNVALEGEGAVIWSRLRRIHLPEDLEGEAVVSRAMPRPGGQEWITIALRKVGAGPAP